MKLKYRPAALADIQSAADYIANVLKNKSAAARLKAKIVQGVALLKENPYMGTSLSSKYDGPPTPIRFIVISRQLVFYEVHDDTDVIEIIRVLDGRSDYLVYLFGGEES